MWIKCKNGPFLAQIFPVLAWAQGQHTPGKLYMTPGLLRACSLVCFASFDKLAFRHPSVCPQTVFPSHLPGSWVRCAYGDVELSHQALLVSVWPAGLSALPHSSEHPSGILPVLTAACAFHWKVDDDYTATLHTWPVTSQASGKSLSYPVHDPLLSFASDIFKLTRNRKISEVKENRMNMIAQTISIMAYLGAKLYLE